MQTNDDDFVKTMLNLSSHDYVMFFTNKGKVYRIKGYEIPEFSRQSKGLPIINLLPLEKDEIINSIIKVNSEEASKYLLFATRKGIVKRTPVEEFENIRTSGKKCITLHPNDELIAVTKTEGNNLVLLGSNTGRMVKFPESEIRIMGRTASGVKGINLGDSECICCEIVNEDDTILLITEKGYGKQTKVCNFRETKRGSKGVKALNLTEKNGSIIDAKVSYENKDIVIMTDFGMTMRMPLNQVNTLSRNAQGVRLINLKDGQKVSSFSLVDHEEETESEENVEIELDKSSATKQ